MKLPDDKYILLSFVNMRLRNQYASLDDLADDFNVESTDIENSLTSIGYVYNEEANQFKLK